MNLDFLNWWRSQGVVADETQDALWKTGPVEASYTSAARLLTDLRSSPHTITTETSIEPRTTTISATLRSRHPRIVPVVTGPRSHVEGDVVAPRSEWLEPLVRLDLDEVSEWLEEAPSQRAIDFQMTVPMPIDDMPTMILHPRVQEPPALVEHFPAPPPLMRGAQSIPMEFGVAHPAPVAIEHRRRTDRRLRLPSIHIDQWLSALIALAAVITIAVTRPGVWALIGALIAGVCLTTWHRTNLRALVTSLMAVLVGVTTVDYLAWRVQATNWSGWEIAVPLLVAEVFGALHTLGLHYTVWPRPEPKIDAREDPSARPVFIFFPTVNEGVELLTASLQGALEARRRYLLKYPNGRVTIVVCNDGLVANVRSWREVEYLARRLGVACVTRTVSGGFKAGNLENARQRMGATDDALVAIFDADQIPHPDFLLKMIPPFADPTVGWVQSGQYYRNLDQPVARWANDQQALFYQILCPGKAAHNAAFICGTNVVIRATALDQIGGLPQDSVTEDFAASIELHPRWRSIFVKDKLAEGLGPMDLPAFLKQQRRWAIGTIGVLRTHWRDILLPRRGGLALDQRMQYLLACTHYLCGVRDLIYLVSPVLFLVFGIPAVRGATLGQFLLHFVPYFVAAWAAFWYAGRRITGLRGIIMGFGSFPVLLIALVTVIRGERTGFMLTAKERRATRSWSHLNVYIWSVIGCVVISAIALMAGHERAESVAISVMWIIYDIALLSAFLWVGIADLRYKDVSAMESVHARALKRRQRSSVNRIGQGAQLAFVSFATRKPRWSLTRHTAWRWPSVVFTAALVFSALAVKSSYMVSPNPTTFTVDTTSSSATYLGLTLPPAIVKTAPERLEQQLCLPFSIIGRTQVVQDSFDFAWADRLSALGQRPWITLQFGVFNAAGQAPLDASLPAIVNGVQDTNLKRWAADIHTYGKPVYLTALLHVDRNWAVTSAVAGGGIPEDAPKAWAHVQSVFAAAGDTNIAWVWAPADPANDQQYAPSSAQINIVLQSMIHYPGTPWPDPNKVLNDVMARHPNKPIILEVSAAGDPAQKSSWLKHVVASVFTHPNVYALMYHDGSPDIHASVVDNNQWSVGSDDQSLQAMLAWQTLVPITTLPCRANSKVASAAHSARP